VAVAVSGAAATGTAHSAAGVERVPVTCYAVWIPGGGALDVGILTPDFPPWGEVVPDAPLPTGGADGVAVFTPGGQTHAFCNDNPFTYSPFPDVSFGGGSGTFSGRGPAHTAREKTPFSFIDRIYLGEGTVVVNANNVRISAELHLTYSNWP